MEKVLWTEGRLDRRSFGQKVLLEKVLWCKGPFGQRSFDFGGPLAKGPLEKVLCDKVLLLKVPLPQPDLLYFILFLSRGKITFLIIVYSKKYAK